MEADNALARTEDVNVIIEVRDATLSTVAVDVWQRFSDELERLERIMERPELTTSERDRDLGGRHAGAHLFGGHLHEDAGGGRAVLKELDWLLHSARREIYARATRELSPYLGEIETGIRDLGGDPQGYTPVLPAVYAKVPLSSLPLLASARGVERITEDQPMTVAMDVSAYAIYSDSWWNSGYTGGIWDLAVVDTGIDGTHPALSVANASVFHTTGQGDACYADNYTDPDDYHGHGTHIAGTVASTNSTYRGVAYGMDELINAKAGWLCTDGGSYMYWSDGMEAIDWAIQTAGADAISFSFGGSPGLGDTPMARYFDAVVDDLGIAAAVAVHNHGPGSGTVTEPATAYNVLSVGNIQDMNTIPRGDDAIHPSSGRGPTGDGRRKPDLVAPGSLIASANSDWETQADFVSWTGSSMATPHVAASILLLMDEGGMLFPAIYKALLLNTAGDRGPAGPDHTYGWGYLNLSEAYIHRGDVYEGHIEDGPVSYDFYKGPALANQKATLVWNRHVNYTGPDYPNIWFGLNDLDLYAFNETDDTLVDTSTSAVDNVEQVVADNDYPSIVYKVAGFGPFAGVTQEHYALSVGPNIGPVSSPSLTTTMSLPPNAELGSPFSISATVSNAGGLNAHSVEVTLEIPQGVTLVSGANPQSLGAIGAGSSAVASWQVRGDTTGLKILSADSASDSYGESFTASSGEHLVEIVDTLPPTSHVDDLPTHETTSVFPVTITASDPNAIASVQLFYRRDGGDWTSYGVDVEAPWSWSFVSATTGGDGLYEFYSLATDAASNSELPPDAPDAFTVVDTEPPASSHTLSGFLGEDGWYRGSVTVSLSAFDSTSGVSSIFYRVNGGQWQSYGDPFTIEIDGVYEVEHFSEDIAGNAETVQALQVKLDSTMPEVAFISPEAGSWIRQSFVTVLWTGSDDASGLSRYETAVDGGMPATLSDNQLILTGLSEGPHVILVRAHDHAGNVIETTLQFGVDSRPPVVTVTSPKQGHVATRPSVTLKWSVADDTSGVAECFVAIDGSDLISVGGETSHVFMGLPEGTHSATVSCSDVAGNAAELTVAFSLNSNPFSPTGPFGPWLLVGLVSGSIATAVVILLIWGRRRLRGEGR